MTDSSFTKFVPGFEFLQGLVKNAGSALPGIGQWVAPTLNPEELAKRIEELRTVQFWLEQNARLLAATIQALEVQRMTLSTLQTMNVPLAQLRDSLKMPEVPAWPPRSTDSEAAEAPARTAAKTVKATVPEEPPQDPAPATPALAVDPTQWWTALSQQFTQLATAAMKDTAADAAKNLAGTLVKQSFDTASETLKRATSMPGDVAKSLVAGTAKPALRTAAKVEAKPASKAAAKSAKPRSPRKT